MYRLLFLYISIASAELEMVQVLVRHGDRAPSFTYPFDITFDVTKHFPRGFSQLTERGFDQAKEVGSFLKKNYVGFVKNFNRRETLIRSSDKDRCIETAIGITNTLFPGEIVPIHTFSHYKDDLLLKPNSVLCKRVEQTVKNEKIKLAETVSTQYQSLFNFLSQKTGWDVDAYKISDVFNVLHRKLSNGVPQPEWVHDVIGNVTELKRQFRLIEFNSDEKSKLRTGYLLGQLSNNMNNEARKKLTVYVTHDATLTSLMYSMGISNHQLIPYAAFLVVEVHKIDGKRYVKIIYRHSNDSVLEQKRIPGCEVLCPLEKYNKYVSSRSISSIGEHVSTCWNEETFPGSHTKPTVPNQHAFKNDVQFLDEDFFSTLFTFASLFTFDLFSFLKIKH